MCVHACGILKWNESVAQLQSHKWPVDFCNRMISCILTRLNTSRWTCSVQVKEFPVFDVLVPLSAPPPNFSWINHIYHKTLAVNVLSVTIDQFVLNEGTNKGIIPYMAHTLSVTTSSAIEWQLCTLRILWNVKCIPNKNVSSIIHNLIIRIPSDLLIYPSKVMLNIS